MTGDGELDLMGVILWRELGLSRAQVKGLAVEQRALATRGKRHTLVELALRFRLIDRVQVMQAERIHRRLAVRPGVPKPLGYSLFEAGLIGGVDLLEALLEQLRTGDRLGAILVRQGLIDADQLAMFLTWQRNAGLALAA